MKRLSRLRDGYGVLAVALLNSTLVVVAINALLHVFYGWYDRTSRSRRLGTYESAALSKAYPGWTEDEIAALFKEEDRFYQTYESFTEFRPSSTRGRYLNVAPEGYRVIRDQGPWPPDRSAFNVFVFGGSTTFGAGLPDHQTIPSYLQEALRREFCENAPRVYNFGRPHYFSTQERVLFEQLVLAGHVPDYAVFLDGVNDFYHFSGVPNWSHTLTELMERQNGRRPWYHSVAEGLQYLPLARAARSMRARLFPIHGPEEDPGGSSFDDPHVIQDVLSRWRHNGEMIRSIARQHGVQVSFVWQPTPTYRYDLAQHVLYKGDLAYFGRHRRSRYGYEAMERVNRESPVGDDFLWLADIQEGRAESLYVDSMHYTAAFSQEMSHRIAQHMRGLACGRAVVSGSIDFRKGRAASPAKASER